MQNIVYIGTLSQLHHMAPVPAVDVHNASLRKKSKVYAVRRYNGSFCTQKQPENASLSTVCIPVYICIEYCHCTLSLQTKDFYPACCTSGA